MKIRELDAGADGAALRACVIELQEFERAMDSRKPRGDAMADDYIDEMITRCRTSEGKILVAERDGEIAGYVTILTRVSSGELDDGNLEHGYIADLLVREKYRRSGVGRKLVEAAEAVAKQAAVRWLRVTAMAGNRAARELYSSCGYAELYVDFEKTVT